MVAAGGIDWSYDLSDVVNGYALEDQAGGRGIVYSSRIYQRKRDWQGKVLAAAEKQPISVGEIGAPPARKSIEMIPEAARTENVSVDAYRTPTSRFATSERTLHAWTEVRLYAL